MSGPAPKCDTCGSELKELLFSRYCPNEDNHGKKLDVTVGGPVYTFTSTGKSTFANPGTLQIQPLPAGQTLRNTQPATPPPGQLPSIMSFSRMTTLVAGSWLFNVQSKDYYVYTILDIPGRMLISSTIDTDNAGVQAFISGQNIKNKTQTEITVVCKALAPFNCKVNYSCLYMP